MIDEISWSKKNNTVIIRPGIMAANTHVTGRCQNSTKNRVLSGELGRKELETANFAFWRSASSPMLGKAMKRMMEIAAAYSDKNSLKYRCSTPQLFAELRPTARRNVPIHPIIEYRKESRGTSA